MTVLAALVGWAWWSTGAAASIPDDRTSAEHPAVACAGANGSSAAPLDPAPEEGLNQTVTVAVPRVALIDSTGHVLNARSNTGQPPQTDDLIYVRVRGVYVVAGAELAARVAAAEWQAVGAPGECAPTHWLGFPDPR